MQQVTRPPALAQSQQTVSVRLDADVIAFYHRSSRGWQNRINAALRKAAKLPKNERRRERFAQR